MSLSKRLINTGAGAGGAGAFIIAQEYLDNENTTNSYLYDVSDPYNVTRTLLSVSLLNRSDASNFVFDGDNNIMFYSRNYNATQGGASYTYDYPPSNITRISVPDWTFGPTYWGTDCEVNPNTNKYYYLYRNNNYFGGDARLICHTYSSTGVFSTSANANNTDGAIKMAISTAKQRVYMQGFNNWTINNISASTSITYTQVELPAAFKTADTNTYKMIKPVVNDAKNRIYSSYGSGIGQFNTLSDSLSLQSTLVISSPSGMALDDSTNYLFVHHVNNQLSVVDVSSGSSMSIVGTVTLSSTTGLGGHKDSRVYFDSLNQRVYIVAGKVTIASNNGIRVKVVDVSVRTNPVEMSSTPFIGNGTCNASGFFPQPIV